MPSRLSKDRPCTGCGKPTRSTVALCPKCKQPTAPKRPERPCVYCGTRTTAKTGACRTCAGFHVASTFDAELGLSGGRWVHNGRGVRVWRKDGAA